MKRANLWHRPWLGRPIAPWLAVHLCRLVLRRPLLTVAVAVAVAMAATAVAAGLMVDGSFMALLPEHDADVAECQELTREAGGSAEMVVALAGRARLELARRLVERLRARPYVRDADVDYPVEFFTRRRLWLLPTAELARLRDTVEAEVERAQERASPFDLQLDDDEPAGEPRAADALHHTLGSAQAELVLPRRYFTKDGRYLLVRVRPVGGFSDMDQGREILARIEADIHALHPPDHGVEVKLAGALPMNQEQDVRMNADLRRAGLWALLLIVLLVTLGFRRMTAPLVLGLPLLVGVVTTLAIARLLFGRLNLVSGFLVSSLLGLGIDFGIHLYWRYLEERATSGGARHAMERAVAGTLAGCTTAAGTTAVALLAVAGSDFKGFREYGVVAAIGVCLALVVTYLVLPPLALLVSGSAHRRPMGESAKSNGLRPGFAWLMVAVGATALGGSAWLGRTVRWHSNFDRLRGTSKLVDFSQRVERDLGGVLAPALIRVGDLAEARQVGRYLDQRQQHPHSAVRRHLSLADMVPEQVAAKRRFLTEMQRLLAGLPTRRLPPADQQSVREALHLLRVPAWSLSDVPSAFRRPFETTNGRSQLVMVWPRSYMVTDGQVMAWASALRRIRRDLRARGLAVRVLDENIVAGKVLGKMRREAPRVLAAAAIAVLLVLLLDFRRARPVLLVAGSLAAGLTWTVGAMGALGIDLNVFNQAVLPTIVGVGLDNAIHIQHRYQQEGRGSVARVVATTGLAALLAAATTAIGFGATLSARHLGLVSMGTLALLGFGCTFTSCTVLLPALLRVLERR